MKTLLNGSLVAAVVAAFVPTAIVIGCGGGATEPANSGGDHGSKTPDAGGGGAVDAAEGVDAGSPKVDASSPSPPVKYTDAGAPSDLIIEPDVGMTPLYNFISSATKTLDMTMYELTDTQVTTLLTTAAKNGVVVRVILDQNLEKKSNTTAYNALAAGNVQVHWADTTYAATHQKTITVDGTTSAVMTINFTPEYYATSRDFAVFTSDPADVGAIETTFNDDFTNTSVTPPVGTNLVWSPTNSQASLLSLINGATSTIITENEEMSDPAIISALASAASRGVDVKVVMTASSSWDSAFTTLKNAGAKISTYSSKASLYIHAKVLIADYGTAKVSAYLGSENYSSASLSENRELGLITTDPAITSSLNIVLTSDFGGASPY